MAINMAVLADLGVVWARWKIGVFDRRLGAEIQSGENLRTAKPGGVWMRSDLHYNTMYRGY
jgi:hypothetical protein